MIEMTAKEYLTRYRDAVRESREIELKIAQLSLRYKAPGAINYSDMPKAHNNSDLSDYMAKLETLTDLLFAKYEKCLGITRQLRSNNNDMAITVGNAKLIVTELRKRIEEYETRIGELEENLSRIEEKSRIESK